MNRRLPVPSSFATLLLATLIAAPLSAGTFIWSGTSTTGWLGNAIVLSDGTADLLLPKAINSRITFGADTDINSITLTGNDGYVFHSQCDNSMVLTIETGLTSTGGANSDGLLFESPISIAGGSSGILTMDAGNSRIVIDGGIIDGAVPTNLYLTAATPNATGAFIFNATCSGNTYTGDTYFSSVDSNTPVTVAFWNSSPFGTGTLYLNGRTEFIAHGSQTVANNVVINTTDVIGLKSWDDTLKFTDCGTTLTLNADVTLVARRAQQGVPSSDNTGIFPTPGPFTRNPIVIGGDIGETGPPRSLTVNGPGVVVLEGNNSYTGGTNVGGSLVFASASSVPGTGLVTAGPNGYVGFGDTTSGEFANFLASPNFNLAGSTGAVGIDTLPGNCTVTFSDPIDLTGANANLRIGTATSAILTGTITPQGTDYLFGNGGGTLYVQSDFTDFGTSNLILTNGNPAVPLTLFLQNAPNYLGNTIANNGFIIFDGYFLPTTGQFTAAGSSLNIGASYIGMSNSVDANASDLINAFNKTNTWGIIGFDTHPGDCTFNVTEDLDLTGFNNGVYLGTATSATLSGMLTPTADGILRLTAARGGILEIDSTLGPGSLSPGVNALSLGTPAPTDVYSNGLIRLPYANTYTGGTTFNSTVGGITVEVGDSNSFGTGPINLPQNVIAGLQASTFVTIPNAINFATPTGMNSPASLYLQGGVIFELSGPISGPGSVNIMDPLNFPYVILSGDNSGLTGDINLYSGYLQLANNNAAGLGTVNFLNNGILRFDSGLAPAPVLHGIHGANGSIELNDFDALTIDISNPANEHEFGGTIGNESSPNATLTVTSTTGGDALYLYGYNNYSGGTIILNKGAVALGNDNALGTGPVTLNAPQGALAVNVGITLSNDLTFTKGSLQGFGTFAPSTINGGPTLVFDTFKGVVPGIFGLGSHNSTGILTLAADTEFANGGKFLWSITDGNTITRPDGQSLLYIDNHNLNITSSAGGFILYLATLDGNGNLGFANLIDGNPYVLPIATTGGSGLITVNGGSYTTFNTADFTIDTTNFVNGVSGTPFLTADANNIYINFTPVPEPSTYALLGLGLSAVLFPALRRRKRV